MTSEPPQMTSEPPHASPAQLDTGKPPEASGVFGNRSFILCAVLLVALMVSFKVFAAKTGMRPGPKAGAYLRKPLRQFDSSKLAPFVLREAGDIKAAILDALGTHEYIQWTLEDTSPPGPNTPPANAPERLIQFFVTYYTDTPGQVPHVPEECYLGGGYSQTKQEIVDVPIPELGMTIPVKLLTFEKSAFLGRESRVVMYVFHANGHFAPDRQIVRTLVNNPHDTHAYFSKVEIGFGSTQAAPTPEKALEEGKRFLAKAIPVLVKEHWPDWAVVEGGADKK